MPCIGYAERGCGGLSASLSAAVLSPAERPLTPTLFPRAGRGSRKCCLYQRVFSNSSRPISMRRISEVPAPIS